VRRALIIDDDVLQIMTARSLLVSIGFDEIYEASNGFEAEDIINALPSIDLILLDLYMPDYDGIEFLDFLKSINCRAPIIIATGAIESVSRSAAIIAEARSTKYLGKINKPITKQKIYSLWPERDRHEPVVA
jgi:CheY-like chemotaxis protein